MGGQESESHLRPGQGARCAAPRAAARGKWPPVGLRCCRAPSPGQAAPCRVVQQAVACAKRTWCEGRHRPLRPIQTPHQYQSGLQSPPCGAGLVRICPVGWPVQTVDLVSWSCQAWECRPTRVPGSEGRAVRPAAPPHPHPSRPLRTLCGATVQRVKPCIGPCVVHLPLCCAPRRRTARMCQIPAQTRKLGNAMARSCTACRKPRKPIEAQ